MKCLIEGTVNLTCEAIADPAANFTWHNNDGPVSKSTRRIFEDTHMSVLTVHIDDQSAFQDYKCVAKNFIGTLERVITLTEGQKPIAPTEVRSIFFNFYHHHDNFRTANTINTSRIFVVMELLKLSEDVVKSRLEVEELKLRTVVSR